MEKKCIKCAKIIDEKTTCQCNADLCCHCCDCQEDCDCDCQSKVDHKDGHCCGCC